MTQPDEAGPLKVWGRRAAFNVQKVLWCCDELGVAYEQVDAGQHYGRNREPFFLAMNPNGRIPVIQLGDFVLWESGAIIRFLSGRAAAKPSDAGAAQRRAVADQWMDWVATTLYYPIFRNYYLYQTRTPEADKDPAVLDARAGEVRELFAIPERQLQRHRFIAGDELTMADFVFGVVADKWVRIEGGVPGFPGVARYHALLSQRPAFQKNVFSHSLVAV
jgi:glutathione S-transferase